MLISMVPAREAVPSLRLLPMRLIERASLGSDVHNDGRHEHFPAHDNERSACLYL
jgi:hypothetical protein